MTNINAIVEKMKNTSVRINMYSFLYGIAAVADPKVKEVFVEEYLKTFMKELYEDQTEEFRTTAIQELKAYFMQRTERK